jgi:DNA-binding response OmpR family regulator
MPVVLVVDDNEMNRDVLMRRLSRQGYEVVIAEDGKQALAAVQERHHDLMLLDIMMPNMNGYEVLEAMRTSGKLHETPVIMISAVDDLDSVVRCIEMGAEDYLFKPFNPVLLKARVEATLQKRSQRAQAVQALDVNVLSSLAHTMSDTLSSLADAATDSTQKSLILKLQTDLASVRAMLG